MKSKQNSRRKKIKNSREKTGRKPGERTITKQKIDIHVEVQVTEYLADEYYNSKTGERVHASFPKGVVDDVNYGGNIRAFLFLLNNDCCTSIDKSRRFLSDLTGGKLNISKGMINKLSKSFAEKTETQRKEIFADMLLSPVMHTDCTNARANGKVLMFLYVRFRMEMCYILPGRKKGMRV